MNNEELSRTTEREKCLAIYDEMQREQGALKLPEIQPQGQSEIQTKKELAYRKVKVRTPINYNKVFSKNKDVDANKSKKVDKHEKDFITKIDFSDKEKEEIEKICAEFYLDKTETINIFTYTFEETTKEFFNNLYPLFLHILEESTNDELKNKIKKIILEKDIKALQNYSDKLNIRGEYYGRAIIKCKLSFYSEEWNDKLKNYLIYFSTLIPTNQNSLELSDEFKDMFGSNEND